MSDVEKTWPCSIEDLLVAASSVGDEIGFYLVEKHPRSPAKGQVWPRESQLLVTCLSLLHELSERLEDLRPSTEGTSNE